MSKAPPEPRDLNVKQIKFVHAYVESGNGTNAVLAAGYSENGAAATATRLLKNPKVKDYLEAYLKSCAAAARVTPKLIFKGLLDLAEDKEMPGQVRKGAYETLSKCLGMQTENKNISHGVSKDLKDVLKEINGSKKGGPPDLCK